MLHQKYEKPKVFYEKVILQTLNFNIRPPLKLIIEQMKSILTMIDKSLDEVLDKQSYLNYTTLTQQIEKENKKERYKRKKAKNKYNRKNN
jgi:hypothetical protein